MLKKILLILQKPLVLGIILTIIALGVTTQNLLLKTQAFYNVSGYTHYNNYLIFKYAYFHLIHNQDLYQLYPKEHYDLYKYSPAFALLMAPLAYLPNAVGLFLWNLLNVLVLFLAVRQLPFKSDKIKLYVVALILIELVTSIQNSQSNGLMAGLLVWAFVFMEKRKMGLASLFIVLTIFIKLFGVVAFSLFIFYPDKLKSALSSIGWIILFTFLPLVVISPAQLHLLYISWLHLLANDHSIYYGLSVAGCLHKWFHLHVSKNWIMLAGAIIFLIPLVKLKCYKERLFRLLFLASMLVWVVIFNYKAESPTFIIAMTGVAIWFFSQKRKPENIILLIIAFIFTELSPTGIFPREFRTEYVIPYVLKAVPCILIWIKIIYDQLTYKSGRQNEQYLLAPAAD